MHFSFQCHCCVSTGITVGFEELIYQVDENGGSIEVCAEIIVGEIDTDVVVNIQTSDGTAVAGSDYTALLNVPLTFEAPSTLACVSISIDNDQVYEDIEEFIGTLTSTDPDRITISPARQTTTIRINDNDGLL